jgi:hypothetical protein
MLRMVARLLLHRYQVGPHLPHWLQTIQGWEIYLQQAQAVQRDLGLLATVVYMAQLGKFRQRDLQT